MVAMNVVGNFLNSPTANSESWFYQSPRWTRPLNKMLSKVNASSILKTLIKPTMNRKNNFKERVERGL